MSDFDITLYPNKGYKEIICKEGHYITNWNGNDILEYCDAKVMCAPIDYDINQYYCVTEEQHNAYLEQQLAKIKEQENNVE